MNRTAAFASIILFGWCTRAVAHGNFNYHHSHVFGTVKETHSGDLVIEDEKGSPVTVRRTPRTEYRTPSGKATGADLRVGDHVVIDFKKTDGPPVALRIRIDHPRK